MVFCRHSLSNSEALCKPWLLELVNRHSGCTCDYQGASCGLFHFACACACRRAKKESQANDVKERLKTASLLSQNDFAGLYYRPKTRETMQSYELILSFIQVSVRMPCGACTLPYCVLTLFSLSMPGHAGRSAP